MKKGFTLIELLVVVLIIGILSAVALPQYTKAVNKARVAEAKIGLKALASGMSIYMNTYHVAPGSLEELDVVVPNTDKVSYAKGDCAGENCTLTATIQNGAMVLYTDSDSDGPMFSQFLCKSAAAACLEWGALKNAAGEYTF